MKASYTARGLQVFSYSQGISVVIEVYTNGLSWGYQGGGGPMVLEGHMAA